MIGLILMRGSIPASAGEPSKAGEGRTHGWVYPRECGGAYGIAGEVDRHWGLSPRVRGSLLQALVPETAGGSIPASAGEPIPA